MEEQQFQIFLKNAYAEIDRELDAIGNLDQPHAEIDISRKWRFARQEKGRVSLGSFERDGKLGSEVVPRFKKAVHPSYDDGSWARVHLPHTWNADDTQDTGPGYWRGIGWYRKSFCLSRANRSKVVRLRIGAANQRAIVWLNGKKVGEHKGGYEGFEFDLTPNVVWGERHNVLTIRVDNLYDPDVAPTVKSDIQWCGGLYRDVRLIFTEKSYFKKAHFVCMGLDVGKPRIELDIALNRKVAASVEAVLCDASGVKIGASKCFIANGAAVIQGPPIAHPRLWSPEDPYLYRLSLKLRVRDQVCDEIVIPVGFRWYKFDPNKGFSLNGVSRKLHGTCWHQVYPGLGNALPVSRHRRDMEVIKDMGCDFFRTSHYTHHDEIIKAADELGIMVMEELPVNKEVGNPDVYTKNILMRLEETVTHHFNHPSIILWGLAGEVNAPADISYAVARNCVAKFKALDPTRLTCMHQPRGGRIAALFDVAGYGLQGSEQTKDEGTQAHREHARAPKLALMDMEYAMSQPGRGIRDGGPHSEEVACDRHEDYLRRINVIPWFCGGAIWHQFDYHSETYDGVIPRVVAFGMADAWRIPKDAYHFYRSQWNPAPMVHICGHWTWSGEEGRARKVRVYSNGEKVELHLNGRRVGSQRAPKGDRLSHAPFVFTLRYAPGALKAIAYFSRHKPITQEVHTAGKPHALEISSSHAEIRYDDFNAHAEITLRVLDQQGHLVPDAAIPVSFYLYGTGELLTQTWPPFGTGTSWYTVAGITRILWRPNGFPGTATIKAYSPGLLQGRQDILAAYPGDHSVDLMRFREFPHGE